MNKKVYVIHKNENIIFLTLNAAEDYLINENPEYCCCKDSTYDFCENMIWEESVNNLIKEVA